MKLMVLIARLTGRRPEHRSSDVTPQEVRDLVEQRQADQERRLRMAAQRINNRLLQ